MRLALTSIRTAADTTSCRPLERDASAGHLPRLLRAGRSALLAPTFAAVLLVGCTSQTNARAEAGTGDLAATEVGATDAVAADSAAEDSAADDAPAVEGDAPLDAVADTPGDGVADVPGDGVADAPGDVVVDVPADVATGATGIRALSDEFEGTALDPSWHVKNGQLADTQVSGGTLSLIPNQFTVWFHEDHGPGLFRTIEGDFRMTTSVRARRASDPDASVSTGFQFAGIIVRDPASDAETNPENYVFSVVGYRGDYFSAETKSTVNDLSMVDGPPWPSTDAELRICRIGDTFQLYIREIGASAWNPAISYDRPGFPDTVQAGPIAYTYTDAYDLNAMFDYVRYAPVSSRADCVVDE